MRSLWTATVDGRRGAAYLASRGAFDYSVDRLTLFAFSADKWLGRPAEVKSIFWLLRAFLRLKPERLLQRGIRLQIIGRLNRLTRPVLLEIERVEKATTTSLDSVADRNNASPQSADAQLDSGVPTFSEALKEQLGLKLQATRARIEVHIIDHVEQPSPN